MNRENLFTSKPFNPLETRHLVKETIGVQLIIQPPEENKISPDGKLSIVKNVKQVALLKVGPTLLYGRADVYDATIESIIPQADGKIVDVNIINISKRPADPNRTRRARRVRK